VHNGQIVLDEPVELRAELEADIEAGAAEIERGEFEDARAVALRLFAKS
jgi:predicted transcriptional regulator